MCCIANCWRGCWHIAAPEKDTGTLPDSPKFRYQYTGDRDRSTHVNGMCTSSIVDYKLFRNAKIRPKVQMQVHTQKHILTHTHTHTLMDTRIQTHILTETYSKMISPFLSPIDLSPSHKQTRRQKDHPHPRTYGSSPLLGRRESNTTAP